MKKVLLALPALIFTAGAGMAACLDVATLPGQSFEGVLLSETVPGPPDYSSIAEGDQPLLLTVLQLDAPICITDAEGMADPALRFTQIQIGGDFDRAATEGRRVRITAEDAFPAHTAYHLMPLVILAGRITPAD